VISLSDTLIAELEAADEYVFGVPMHNFSIPSTVKLWIDQIVRAGRTFSYGESGPAGLLKNKKATFLIASGGVYQRGTPTESYDFVEPYLRAIFDFVGVVDTDFIVAGGAAAVFPVGSRVMFTGPYGVFEDGAYSEWLAVRKEDLCLIPEGVDDVSAAGIPVAYLTAQMALTLAGFQAGKTVLAPAIGGSVGNAVTQLARALGAKHAISSTTNQAKAEQAKALGFNEVIDMSFEKLGDGVRRITGGYGADIVIDGVGGEVLSEALGALALGGSLTTLGYAGGRKATIDVTNLIWKRASIKSFILFAQPQADAWNAIVSLLQSGAIKPIVAKTFPLAEAADALRYLVEGRPFGRVVLTI